jgi:hypothetical protein
MADTKLEAIIQQLRANLAAADAYVPEAELMLEEALEMSKRHLLELPKDIQKAISDERECAQHLLLVHEAQASLRTMKRVKSDRAQRAREETLNREARDHAEERGRPAGRRAVVWDGVSPVMAKAADEQSSLTSWTATQMPESVRIGEDAHGLGVRQHQAPTRGAPVETATIPPKYQ